MEIDLIIAKSKFALGVLIVTVGVLLIASGGFQSFGDGAKTILGATMVIGPVAKLSRFLRGD